tara:strand:+ start:1519 stop:2157 length:639 start_codon:yes stop_codon:yes gene_type:complete
MSGFQQNSSRTGSIQNESNKFKARPATRGKVGKYVPPQRNNKQGSIKRLVKVDMDNIDAFPAFNNQVAVVVDSQSEQEDKKNTISDYLKTCMKTKEETSSQLDPGWMALKRCENTHNIVYSTDGRQYDSFDQYENELSKIHEEEEEVQYYERMERLALQNEQRLFDDYELYGENSIMYQEYCRHQRYLEEYPEDEDLDNDNGEDSGEDSGYD